VNISSYNVTDVGYHYIGLRVLNGLPPTANRDEQTSAISRGVLKYASDKALRLMLPAPKGTFETVGEKVCRELVHFRFARSVSGAYEITEPGKKVLELLNGQKYADLHKTMVVAHLQAYDNLRSIVQRHLELNFIWRPIVETRRLTNEGYLQGLLEPTFGIEASLIASTLSVRMQGQSASKVEDALHDEILRQMFPGVSITVALFKSLADRLVTLRLLNVARATSAAGVFEKSYSPCVASSPPNGWYTRLDIPLDSGGNYAIYYCEPDMSNEAIQQELIKLLYKAFQTLPSQAGYCDLPAVRDFVCEHLRIPESAFDEGVNFILDLQPSPITVGLHYEGISARRKPLARTRGNTQIYNLIRRA
jgi:hypothetical protein